MRNLLVIFFVLMCTAQWAVPVKMIFDQESILSSGKVYKFRTAPVDPTDPFRGSYVTLYYSENSIPLKEDLKVESGDEVYLTLSNDLDGFARIQDYSLTPPVNSNDYMRATVSYSGDTQVTFDFPFNRFYVQEFKASEAEKQYWEANRRDSNLPCYALVRIKDGEPVLENVMIGDKSIIEIVDEMRDDRP